MYLLDTMVVSERSKARPNAEVAAWLERNVFEVTFLSVLSFGEIERGIHRVEQRLGLPAHRHRQWLQSALLQYHRRILPVTTEIAFRWGRLSYELKHSGPDLLIAATALEHDLTVVTRNIRHFEPTGVRLLNPYEA